MWEYDLNRLSAMQKYWQAHPPLHKLVAGFIGYENKSIQSENIETKLDDFIELLTQ